MSKNRRNRDSFNEINITPLTDIFLVLLIIMMVVAPMLDQQGLSLMVPNTQEVKNPKESKIITVKVSDAGTFSVDGEDVTNSNLVFKIKELSNEKKDGLMILSSENATHGAVVAVMDAARTAGVSAVSLSQE